MLVWDFAFTHPMYDEVIVVFKLQISILGINFISTPFVYSFQTLTKCSGM